MERSIKQNITDAGSAARIALGIIKKLDGYIPSKLGKQLLNIERSLDEINKAAQELETSEEEVVFNLLSVADQRKMLEEQCLQAQIHLEGIKNRIKKYYYNVTIPELREDLSLEDGIRYGRYMTYKGGTATLNIPMDMITHTDFVSFIARNASSHVDKLMVNGKMTYMKDILKLHKNDSGKN